MTCAHRGPLHARGDHVDVYHCKQRTACTLVPSDLKFLDGSPVPMCARHCDDYLEPKARTKFNFCYVMGSNRQHDVSMIAAAIQSARNAGVLEDFHAYAVANVPGAINHTISHSLDWDNHMRKIELVATTLNTHDYEAAVWLDSDSWFTRDPGDMRRLLRDEPVWVSMEGDLTDPRAAQRKTNWWTMWAPGLGSPDWITIMRQHGCKGKTIYSTNGGMWIVRKTAVDEFQTKINNISRSMRINNPGISDEPPLAVIGQTMVNDFERNTVQETGDVWAADWWAERPDRKPTLPDGTPWTYHDWLTGDSWKINPAIVHVMRQKHLMTNPPQTSNIQEPVGTTLKQILTECGVTTSDDCACNQMRKKMDEWGIAGCMEHQREIIEHLDAAAKTATWMQWGKIAAAGYLSSRSLLLESIKRVDKNN